MFQKSLDLSGIAVVVYKYLLRMLNKNGRGILYFGVRNDGEILDQEIGSHTLREISQAIVNAIKPQIIPTIIMELCDDKNVIKVTVPLNHKRNVENSFSRTEIRTMDSSDSKILELMKENANISVKEISRSVELGMTTITKRIHCLNEEGIVERKGSKKTGQWIVKQ